MIFNAVNAVIKNLKSGQISLVLAISARTKVWLLQIRFFTGLCLVSTRLFFIVFVVGTNAKAFRPVMLRFVTVLRNKQLVCLCSKSGGNE